MIRFLKQHGLSMLVAVVMVAGAWAAYHRWLFIDNFGVVVESKLYRCRQPRGRDWRLLEQHDIRAVVNLRPADEDPRDFSEQQQACRAASAELVSIPMSRPIPTDVQLRRFLDAVAETDGAVLLHCEHGRDRAGVLAAAYRIVEQNWTVRKAVAEMFRYRGRPISKRRWRQRTDYLHQVRRDALAGHL